MSTKYVKEKKREEKLDKDTHIVVDAIISKLKDNIYNILLYGSYGRDEGAFFQNGNKIYPYNDYDLLVVVSKLLSNNDLEEIKKTLQNNLDIKWIDLSQKSITELKALKPSIFNYDLKYASKVIYGDKNILDIIPTINASKLPLEEANILFRTRMWTLLGSLNINGFNSTLAGDESRFFRNQMAKAILAIVDVLLLQNNSYDSSYVKRVKVFNKLFSHKQELCLLSEWALSEKLTPKVPKMDKNEVLKLYSQVHKLYINEMFVALGKRFHTEITRPEKLELLWKYYPINILRRIAYLLIKPSAEYEKSIMLDSIQLYLLMAYNKGGFKSHYLLKAKYFMKLLNNKLNPDISWNEARLIAAQMRLG